MDNLQHIDELLKSSASSFANSYEIGETDWLAVEKKLRHRKNRIYALWFFLALILVSTSIVLTKNIDSNQDYTVIESLAPKANNTREEKISQKTENIKLGHNKISETRIQAYSSSIDVNNAKQSDEGANNSNLLITQYPEIFDSYKINLEAKPANNLFETKSFITYPFITTVPAPIAYVEHQSEVTDKNLFATTRKTTTGYWETGVSFTPSISSKFVSENASLRGLINRSYYANAANFEKAAFSSSTGINTQYHFAGGFFLASGLFISERSEYVDYNYAIKEYPLVNNNRIEQYVPLSSAAYINVKHSGSNSYHFVEIPLNLGYKQEISRNFELRGQLGMSYLQLFKLDGLKADYTSLELKDLNDYDLKQNNLTGNAKIGIYLNRNRFCIGAEPIFNYNFNSISGSQSALKIKPYNYGFNISTHYKFKN